MKRLWKPLLGVLTLGILAGVAASSTRKSEELVVHEWGTFLSMSNSDGASLDGMYHEEHALPDFVHARSTDQLHIPSARLKGETPVIYFYSDTPRDVGVEVRFPTGLWTQWYPQACLVGPQLSETGRASAPTNGRIVWRAHLTPPSVAGPSPSPPAAARDALWNYAREVDAAYIQTTDATGTEERVESERFLFYRGLGTAPLPLRFSAEANGTLHSLSNETIHHVFVLKIENGKGAYAYRPQIDSMVRLSNLIPSMAQALRLEEFVTKISDELKQRLVASGLFEKEANAMVNTWRNSYFETDGVRALVVMPQSWTDAFIPMRIKPQPREVVRVMVGRLELLTPEREELANEAIRNLASSESELRRAGFEYLRTQGRYVEPIVRLVERTTTDESLRSMCRQLLAADFVTELRSALHKASDGSRQFDEPLAIRAQLATLLREIGLVDQAKEEAAAVLSALKDVPVPAISDSESRVYLRTQARAFEAMGESRSAAKTYERFVEFSAQVSGKQDCRFCHSDAGPKQMAWFRNWWAGEKFAQLAIESEGADALASRLEKVLAENPSDLATRMKLAYLRTQRGDTKSAATLWSAIETQDRESHVAER